MASNSSKVQQTIAVVGAGAAGLCCARHFSRDPQSRFLVHVFEKSNTVGGTWVYSEMDSSDRGVHSSIYKNLRTNLPKEIMRFVDFPFPSHLPSFVGHEDVLHYLQSYAEHFDLNQCIQFNTEVEEVTPVVRGQLEKGVLNESVNGDSELLFQDTVKWRVMAKNLMSGEITCKDYDRVIVCNGHYSEGYIPTIPGIHHFSDDAVHSHCYRDPEDYTNQCVLVVGSGSSGTDIILDLSPCCSQVYISNRGPPIAAPLPSNVMQVPGVVCFKDGKLVEFTDGTVVQVDTVMFATGYNYTFPFLDKECGVMVDSGSRIRPLYKHTFNCLHPSMAFVGIQLKINPFPFFDYQVKWIKAVWSGENSLPSEKDLFREGEEFYHENLRKGLSLRKAGHFVGHMQWKFLEEIVDEPLDPVYRAIYDAVYKERRANLIGYKKINYKVTSISNFEVLRPEDSEEETGFTVK